MIWETGLIAFFLLQLWIAGGIAIIHAIYPASGRFAAAQLCLMAAFWPAFVVYRAALWIEQWSRSNNGDPNSKLN